LRYTNSIVIIIIIIIAFGVNRNPCMTSY